MFNKIAIIALPRTGSSSLYYYITSFFQDISRSFEPMNFVIQKNAPTVHDLIEKDKIIIKHLINQEIRVKRENNPENNQYTKPDVSHKIIKNFDRVVLLTRKNKIKMHESLYFSEKTGIWFDKYTSEGKLDGIEKFSFHPIAECDKYLSWLSIQYNLPLFYYEDLLYNKNEFNKLLEYIQVPYSKEMYKKYIDPKNKYRQDG